MSLAQLELIRRHELGSIEKVLAQRVARGGRVLDIGAGTGWQAKHFSDAGYAVTAIDMPSSVYVSDRVFPIVEYDGHHIPAPDASFDAVYSSNVLEHVAHADEFQREILRVLKPDGIVVHIVPSGAWRAFSNLAHYPYIVKRAALVAGGSRAADGATPAGATKPAAATVGGRVRRVLMPQRDGEVGNAFTEIWHFSRWRWRRLFERNGWRVESRGSNQLFYTAYYLLGTGLSVGARSTLSHLTGGACHVFILRPAAGTAASAAGGPDAAGARQPA